MTDSGFEYNMFFDFGNAALALLVLVFTSASDLHSSSMMLPRYVKDSTFSRVSPPSVIGLVFFVL
ncbi:unnamed protein product [Schistosoma margrebowiei]|uniref:Uncharacterized protein n=1 Tax=Schistosoma margrebowiei TaxID=48269 RepID=A0A3P7WJV0_9TREM|nr:unnamed protein product [Schistosoma margrebowiei]